jgi:hypothetical protein
VLWCGLYNVVLNAAEPLVDAGTAYMLVGVGPVLIAVFAGVLLREGFPLSPFAGCAVAFAGVVVIGWATSARSLDAGLGAAREPSLACLPRRRSCASSDPSRCSTVAERSPRSKNRRLLVFRHLQVFLGGRCWVRTSDFCRVKAVR